MELYSETYTIILENFNKDFRIERKNKLESKRREKSNEDLKGNSEII